ncbi:MAG: methyltransferase domain-containing protein [Candidatus Nanoarchaeia archaeon]|jgi:2-polyprenyl-3-methyl-5-hydroxy-6-metoxy-1,4-benzoquinol methylase
MKELLDKLKSLNLPNGDYAIFGSAPMGIRGIRETNHDLDLIVKPELWDELKKKYGLAHIKGVKGEVIIIDKDIEVYNSWGDWIKDIIPLIDSAELIQGFPFVKLKYVLDWKIKYGREKDKKDAILIREYLDKHYFDEEYSMNKECFGLKPSNIAAKMLNFIKQGKVLDVGAGYGRNSLFFSKNGFEVTAIDPSKEGIKQLNTSAKSQGLKIKALTQNILRYKTDEFYDLILAVDILQFLNEDKSKKAINTMKTLTAKNGFNAITVFTIDNPAKNFFKHLFRKNELKDYYNNWEIIEYKEFIIGPEKHGTGAVHTHAAAELIARKK